jgi:hypothetical protein
VEFEDVASFSDLDVEGFSAAVFKADCCSGLGSAWIVFDLTVLTGIYSMLLLDIFI